MKLLLDTHIWLWSLREPHRVGARTMRHLRDAGNELWLSPISIWEFMLLVRKGRVHLREEPDGFVAEAINRFIEAPLTFEVARAADKLNLHGDPADRFLAATAKVFDLTLVTADQRLLGLGDIATLANR